MNTDPIYANKQVKIQYFKDEHLNFKEQYFSMDCI